jgi:hypothetical protein
VVISPDRASEEEWEKICADVELFQANWAMVRKESGLGPSLTTKWMCPALAGTAGCPARGTANVELARRKNLPIITPPRRLAEPALLHQKTVDFTPDPTDHNHQVKLAQASTTAVGAGAARRSGEPWLRGSSGSSRTHPDSG